MPSVIFHELSTFTGLGTIQSQFERYLVMKQADQSVTNNTTPQNDTDLLFALTNATDIWRFRLFVPFNVAGTTSGFKIAVTGTAAPTNLRYTVKAFNGVAVAVLAAQSFNAFASSFGFAVANAGDHFLEIDGMLESAAGGSVQLQFAQNTTDAVNSVTVRRGAYLEANRLK